MVVCSRHFSEKNYFPGIKCRTRRLKNSAIPDKNLPITPTYDAARAACSHNVCQEKTTRAERQSMHPTATRKVEQDRQHMTMDTDPLPLQVHCEECQDEADPTSSQDRTTCDDDVSNMISREMTYLGVADKAVQVTSGDLDLKFIQLLMEANINAFT